VEWLRRRYLEPRSGAICTKRDTDLHDAGPRHAGGRRAAPGNRSSMRSKAARIRRTNKFEGQGHTTASTSRRGAPRRISRARFAYLQGASWPSTPAPAKSSRSWVARLRDSKWNRATQSIRPPGSTFKAVRLFGPPCGRIGPSIRCSMTRPEPAGHPARQLAVAAQGLRRHDARA